MIYDYVTVVYVFKKTRYKCYIYIPSVRLLCVMYMYASNVGRFTVFAIMMQPKWVYVGLSCHLRHVIWLMRTCIHLHHN